jgi:hypothetical protein
MWRRQLCGADLGDRRLERLSDSWPPHNKPVDFGRSPLPSGHPLPWSKGTFPKVLARHQMRPSKALPSE